MRSRFRYHENGIPIDARILTQNPFLRGFVQQMHGTRNHLFAQPRVFVRLVMVVVVVVVITDGSGCGRGLWVEGGRFGFVLGQQMMMMMMVVIVVVVVDVVVFRRRVPFRFG